MTPYHKIKFFALAGFALTLVSCATQQLATQNTDDVYFKNIEAVPVTYATVAEKRDNENAYSNRNGYDRNDDSYYDSYEHDLRFNRDSWRNNYSWRDYYYMDRYSYDPFFGPSSYLGFNNFYGNGWGFSLGYNTPFYSYNMPFYSGGYYNYGYYGPYYGISPYGGIYSYYNPGYYGSYGGYYGNPYYGGGVYYRGTARNLKPRPRGTDDNVRANNGNRTRIPLPESRATRSSSGDSGNPRTQSTERGGSYIPYGRPTRSTGNSTDSRTQGQQPTSQPTSRPTRPTRDTGNDTKRETAEPVSRPTSRPTRTETPSYTPSRSTESSGSSSRSSSGSSSSGSSSSGRPSR